MMAKLSFLHYLVVLWVQIEENWVLDGDDYTSGLVTGTLSVSLYFAAGEEGLFDSYVENEALPAVIPEPTTILLLGPGLLALAGLRRKFKNA